MDEKTDGVVVISSAGVIKVANKVLSKMLGYKKDELVGKNVSVLMGPPHNALHNRCGAGDPAFCGLNGRRS